MATYQQLIKIFPKSGRQLAALAAPLAAAMAEFGIDTPSRQAAFLAQVGHESGEFMYLRELGSNAYLAKYDTGKLAAALGNTPVADGDGQRYRGRGLIQVTGRRNYELCGFALGLDLLGQPELLEQPAAACRSAAWYWYNNRLNAMADAGDFDRITRRINGGQNGRDHRRALWVRAKAELGVL